MLVCEAAGFDVVLVETVGVGQSEVAVAGMVDLFLLLLSPGAGDDLQGVKRGIVELADLVVVNKADGALLDLARHTASDYTHALHLVGNAEVLLASAREGTGIGEVWTAVHEHVQAARAKGALAERRADQAREWMWAEVTETLVDRLQADARVRTEVDRLEADVRAGRMSPAAAARRLLDD
jgi:LAO/AO transport system kinase